MSLDPTLFIGAVKTSLRETVTVQSAFPASHISRETPVKKVKRPHGPRSNIGLCRQSRSNFAKQQMQNNL
jgi:hypothetical protein